MPYGLKTISDCLHLQQKYKKLIKKKNKLHTQN